MATRVRHAEYEFVQHQAAGKALCPFCNGWHDAATGAPLDPEGTCVARYMRVRNTAIVVRGVVNQRGGGYQVAGQRDRERCMAHAFAIKNPS